VHEKTGGNPFFAIQFFSALAEEGLLSFDPVAPAWQWDIKPDPRQELYRQRDGTQWLEAEAVFRHYPGSLETARLPGNVAEIATLTLVHGETEEAMLAALWEAVYTGLVFREDSAYKFLRDRIQQAAYTLIPEEQRAKSTCASPRAAGEHDGGPAHRASVRCR